MTLGTNRSKQRLPTPDESNDQQVNSGDFFGTTSEHGAQVWHFDGVNAVMVGVANPDHRSMAVLIDGEGLREAVQRVPMFAQTPFILHRMELPPGAYYPRMSRPSDQHPLESLGTLPEYWDLADIVASTLNQVRSLVGMLDTIFQSIHPSQENMGCYGNLIRNLLILACTECEAQWRGVLAANGIKPKCPRTTDYVKLAPAMKLSEYSVKLHRCPWLEPFSPFNKWDSTNSTQTIPWYNNYNLSKHDREGAFNKATLGHAIEAVAALWIMVAAQFGNDGIREFDDLYRYFHFNQIPKWEYPQVYTYAYDGYSGWSGPRNHSF